MASALFAVCRGLAPLAAIAESGAAAASDLESGSRAVACRPLPPFTDPHPSRLLDAAGLFVKRFGRIAFLARGGVRLRASTYRATGFDPVRGPIWFVMHGAGRTADGYLAAAAPVAERRGALAIAVRFPKSAYPNSNAWTLGLTKRGKLDGGVYDPDAWRDVGAYVHAEIEHLFEAVRGALGGSQAGYYLLGHSAGAQFVHRLLTFLPHARVLGAVAANAGWYTLPGRGGGADPNWFMPYGLQGSPLADADLCPLVSAPLTILLGERDTATPDRDANLRGTPQAMAQGATRLARGRSYFEAGRARAEALGARFGWRLAVVPGAGHDKDELMASADFFLFEPEATPCTPTPAAEASGLWISEIQADPPRGPAGDTNADGVRDADADEFVELVNVGASPLCLAGWTLGDAGDPERHRFPLGRALPPGGAVVVFGGGQPTGAFGGAEVQWVAPGGRLDLSNAGDLLQLRDAGGRVHSRLSWGDCGGAACAAEHLEGELAIDGAIARWPEPRGAWTRHRQVAPAPASPGTRAEGSPW